MENAEKENKRLKILIVILLLLLVGAGVYIYYTNFMKTNNDNDAEKIIENKFEYPIFDDDFEEAMFIYSWFYDNMTLYDYCDGTVSYNNNNYQKLSIKGINTISDMKEKAYRIFDKELVDSNFNKLMNRDNPVFIQREDDILILDGYVKQNNYNMGYSSYDKTKDSSGNIIYTVNIKANVMGDNNECDLKYDYKYELTSDGTYKFLSFENPATLCINDVNK